MNLSMIHLSIPIRDVESTLTFYRDLLGCVVTRVQSDRIDFEFFGHHLVAQLSELEAAHRSVNIGKDSYPLRHFGVIVEPHVYEDLLSRLRKAKVPFAMEPKRIFLETPREQSVFLVYDPSGNAVEVKGLMPPSRVFSAD